MRRDSRVVVLGRNPFVNVRLEITSVGEVVEWRIVYSFLVKMMSFDVVTMRTDQPRRWTFAIVVNCRHGYCSGTSIRPSKTASDDDGQRSCSIVELESSSTSPSRFRRLARTHATVHLDEHNRLASSSHSQLPRGPERHEDLTRVTCLEFAAAHA